MRAVRLANPKSITISARALFHDYTVYSGTKNAYVQTRLVLEIGLDHGSLIPMKHVRIVWLTDSWTDAKVLSEWAFYSILAGLIIDMLLFFRKLVK